MKYLVTKKMIVGFETEDNFHYCREIASISLVEKKVILENSLFFVLLGLIIFNKIYVIWNIALI